MSAAWPLPVCTPGPFDGSRESFGRHVEALGRMMAGDGCFWSAPFAPPPLPNKFPIALVVPTSGSTGTPKAVAHTLGSVHASQDATARALGGHGAWLPFLPPTHIAGIQVVARALRTQQLLDHAGSGGSPASVLGPFPRLADSFTPRTVLSALDSWDIPELPLFTSFVPTQLRRLLSPERGSVDPAMVAALQRFDAILVGGAATPAPLLDQARDLGIRLVTTYGSSETAGGCVYNGQPVPGVRLSLTSKGVLQVDAPSVALGYLSPSGELTAFPTAPTPTPAPGHGGTPGNTGANGHQSVGRSEQSGTGARRFVTSDLAELIPQRADDPSRGSHSVPQQTAHGNAVSLRILGRADHVINTGGMKVNPLQVEAAILTDPRIAAALIVGVPDDQWGERVEALVVPASAGKPATEGDRVTEGELSAVKASAGREDLRAAVECAITACGLPRQCVPKITHLVSSLPLLAPGKVDRAAARVIAQQNST